MIVAGKTPAKDGAWYVIGQVLGAVAGAAIIFLIANDLPDFSTADPAGGGPGFATNGWGDRSPGGYGLLPMILAETILTGVLMWSVLGTTTKKFSPAAGGLAVGMSLTVIHLISIPITNTSVNPARSLGVAIFNTDALAQVVAFIVFPILGALIAAYAWMALKPDADFDEEVEAAA
jgi:aquaporin Z